MAHPLGVGDLILGNRRCRLIASMSGAQRIINNDEEINKAMNQHDRNLADDPERDALRAKHQVRLTTLEEEGYDLPRLPDGIYGFTTTLGRRDAPLFRRPITQSYEVHKLLDGTVMLVGYVSAEDAHKLATSKEVVNIRLFPDRQDNASELVNLPEHRVVHYKEHSQRSGEGLQLDITLED